MFADLTLYTLAFLALAAFSAGLIDAIAGGGGLIQLPALMIGLAKSSNDSTALKSESVNLQVLVG